MFGNFKIDNYQKMLVKELAKELNLDENVVLYEIIEMGFSTIRLGTEDDEKIRECFDVLKNNKGFMDKATLIRKWWEDGAESKAN